MRSKFTNTGRLVRFLLRREWLSSSVWVVLLSAFSIALAPGLARMFDDTARQALIITVNTPAMISMLGPIYGMDNYTPGAMYFNMMVQWMMLTAGVMNFLLVIRHTRTDEEHGRTDMLRSLPVGQYANLSAVMLLAFLVDLLIAVFTGVGIALCGVESMGWNGAMLYGAAIGAVGFVFAALAAVFSQLCMTSRGAIGMSVMALGFLYLLRGAGDIGNETLSYISPLGLAQRTQAFVENNWFPIPILLAESAVITAAAFVLNGQRDVRQSYFPERRGRDHAGASLHSPFGLAFRLLKPPFFGWIAGMFVLGASYGSILGTIETFVQSSEFYSMVIGANSEYSTAQMFISMVTSLMALCAAFPVLTMVLKVRSEEADGYAQNVLSKAVSKYRYLTGYVVMAAVMAVLAQCATALGIYAAAMAVLPDPSTLPLGYLMKACLVFAPALWVMLGITVLLIGLYPKGTVAVWFYFGFSFFASFLGRIPDIIPDWLRKLTPFAWSPSLPVDEINAAALVIMTVLALCLTAAGIVSYRRRDVSAA